MHNYTTGRREIVSENVNSKELAHNRTQFESFVTSVMNFFDSVITGIALLLRTWNVSG
jgi:hypothetical protein